MIPLNCSRSIYHFSWSLSHIVIIWIHFMFCPATDHQISCRDRFIFLLVLSAFTISLSEFYGFHEWIQFWIVCTRMLTNHPGVGKSAGGLKTFFFLEKQKSTSWGVHQRGLSTTRIEEHWVTQSSIIKRFFLSLFVSFQFQGLTK